MSITQHTDRTPVFETSLIFQLCPAVRARVKALMTHPRLADHAQGLPQPHVTALFVGFVSEPLLQALEPELAVPPHPVIHAQLSGWGFFTRKDGTSNIHLRVRPEPSLVAVHQWAIAVCRRLSWTPPADISAQNYLPHITVADGPLNPEVVLPALQGAPVPSQATLSGLQLRAHPWPS